VVEPSSGTNILEDNNTDSESRTTIQVKTDNGSCSTGELDPSDASPIEEEQSPSKPETTTTNTKDTLLLLESTRETHTKR